ncbi:MAG: hypothetical protein WCO55_05150 [Candidatus Falkowbacteria bacterium]
MQEKLLAEYIQAIDTRDFDKSDLIETEIEGLQANFDQIEEFIKLSPLVNIDHSSSIYHDLA